MHFPQNPLRDPHINKLIHAQYHNSHFLNQPSKSPIIKKNKENLMSYDVSCYCSSSFNFFILSKSLIKRNSQINNLVDNIIKSLNHKLQCLFRIIRIDLLRTLNSNTYCNSSTSIDDMNCLASSEISEKYSSGKQKSMWMMLEHVSSRLSSRKGDTPDSMTYVTTATLLKDKDKREKD